jgi:hypothetical protein
VSVDGRGAATSAIVSLFFELGFDQLAKCVMNRFVFEPREHFFEESKGEQLVGRCFRDSAGLQIKFLLGIDARGRGAVRTPDVVGLDLETRQRVRFRIITQHQIPVALVRISLLRIGIDDNQPRKNRAGISMQRVFVEEIRLRVRRLMDLQGALIKFLCLGRDGQSEHFRNAAGRLKLGKGFVTRLASAEMEIQ